MILRLNIRHQLPQTAQQVQRARLDKAAVVPARVTGHTEQGTSNQGATQPVTQLDNYPSRRAWGSRTMGDFLRESEQKGLNDVQAGTSRRTQEAWARAENGAKPGDDIAQQYHRAIFPDYPIAAETLVDFQLMDGPIISVTPSRVVGEPEVGENSMQAETTPFPLYQTTPGSARTYVENEGFIRRWVTIDKYDIYA